MLRRRTPKAIIDRAVCHGRVRFPPHPGETPRHHCLKALGLTATAAAKGLGVSRVSRVSLSELLNGRNGGYEGAWTAADSGHRVMDYVSSRSRR